MRTDLNRTALSGASRNAAKAFQATKSPEFAHYPEDEKSAWAMAAVIHCDICRLVIALDECEREGGIARLLCMADIASKLYEARNWYNNAGTKILRGICARRSFESQKLNESVETLKREHQVHRVNKYEKYRNKLGYHYDAQTIKYLEEFGDEDSDEFFEILKSFVKFSGDWAKLTKAVIHAPGL